MSNSNGLKKAVGCSLSNVWLVVKRTWEDVNDNEILTRASAIAFGAMMAAVPFLALVLTIAALLLPDQSVGTCEAARSILNTIETLMGAQFPEEAHLVIQEQIARLQTNQPIAVLTFSLAITIWLASGLYAAIIDGLNRIYGIKDTRPYWKFRLTAIWMTIVQSVILLVAVGLIFAFPLVAQWVGLTLQPQWIATAVTWLIIFLMVLASFALTFAAGPNVEQAHRWVTPGSVFGAVIFLASTYGFRVYVQNLAHYDVTYGSLGGVMVLLFWFYIASLVLLLAGEVNKVCHYAREWSHCGDNTVAACSTGVAAVEEAKSLRRNWKHCPQCGSSLTAREEHSQVVLTCTACKFVDWNNPIPVVAALIVHEDKVVLVKRGVAPFVGRWCLPRGFLKTDENPKAAAVREVGEETGFIILLKRMLNACNPSPKNFPLNQVTMFYLATIAGGEMQHGDDADEVGLFSPNELPDICFGSDVQLIEDWFAGVHGTVDQPINYAPPRSQSSGAE